MYRLELYVYKNNDELYNGVFQSDSLDVVYAPDISLVYAEAQENDLYLQDDVSDDEYINDIESLGDFSGASDELGYANDR